MGGLRAIPRRAGARMCASMPAAAGCRRRPSTTRRPDFVARSVTLASERLGIIARMDLVEGEDGTVTPVDTKKGKRPHVAEGAYEPERVQVCAQALILEDAGCEDRSSAVFLPRPH